MILVNFVVNVLQSGKEKCKHVSNEIYFMVDLMLEIDLKICILRDTNAYLNLQVKSNVKSINHSLLVSLSFSLAYIFSIKGTMWYFLTDCFGLLLWCHGLLTLPTTSNNYFSSKIAFPVKTVSTNSVDTSPQNTT